MVLTFFVVRFLIKGVIAANAVAATATATIDVDVVDRRNLCFRSAPTSGFSDENRRKSNLVSVL